MPPLTRADRIERPQLRSLLDRALKAPLTVIAAPAGFGKTTSLTDWISHLDHEKVKVAWLSLEPDDSDPERLFHYALASIDRASPGAVKNTMTLVNSTEWPDPETRLISLVNDIAEMKDELVLALDDYHVIDNDRVHQGIGMLVERLPGQAHIIITSRREPSLPLHRLRARGLALEIGPDQLRFSPEEVERFLNGPEALSVDSRSASLLQERTEGWAAGVQLAAISLRGGRAVNEVLNEFTGENRYLFSYFAEEALRGLPGETRDFLLDTSVLERMTGALCDAVTGGAGSAAVLEDLALRNMFVVRLDDRGEWYRYHHLFSEFLRSHAERDASRSLPAQHMKASAWYESQGLVEQAVTAAIAGKGFEKARELADTAADDLMAQGRMAQVISWASRIPEEVQSQSPSLLLTRAWSQLLRGDIEATEQLVQRVGGLLRERAEGDPALSPDPAVRLHYATCRGMEGYVEVERGSVREGLRMIKEARRLMPPGSTFAQSFLALGEGIAQWANNEVDEARLTLRRVSDETASPFLYVLAVNCLAQTYIVEARAAEAKELAERAIAYVAERGSPNMPVTAMSHNLLAMIAWQQDRHDDAERHLQRVRQVAPGTESEGDLMWAAATALGVRQAKGDFPAAIRSADDLISISRAVGNSMLIERAFALKVKVLLAAGRIEDAVLEAEAGLPPVETIPDGMASVIYPFTEVLKAWARLYLATDRAENAREIALRLLEMSDGTRASSEQLDARILLALAAFRLGEVERAVAEVTEALRIGERGEFVRAFADEGAAMGELLRYVSSRHSNGARPARRYVEKLIAACAGEAPPVRREPAVVASNGAGSLAEPLTAAGSSNNDIAGELFVTAGTVKTHVNNLYRKMEVRSRTQAVARARELGIL
jgi:LuxR family maltose regulon positive regulatory protein